MRSVIYSNDMEPITIIELPKGAEDFLKKHGSIRLAVQLPIVAEANQPEKIICIPNYIVNIQAYKFIRKTREGMLLFTDDEESALLLRCTFLPGQYSGLNEIRREAFARGFFDALLRIRDDHP